MKILAHNDFDGVVSAIVAKTLNPHADIIFCDYSNINQYVEKHIVNHYLLLLDISIDVNTADWIEENIKKKGVHGYPITIYDHHKTSEWLLVNFNMIYDAEKCGAKVYYDHLLAQNQFTPIKQYDDLVYLANDYDMWLHKSPESKRINMLLYELGFDRFVTRFLANPDIATTRFEDDLLELAQERRDKTIRKQAENIRIVQTDGNIKMGVILDDEYASEVAEYVRTLDWYRNVDCLMFVNIMKGKVSLRQCHSDLDLSVMAKRFGGGGHKNSAGFNWHFDIEAILEISFERVGL